MQPMLCADANILMPIVNSKRWQAFFPLFFILSDIFFHCKKRKCGPCNLPMPFKKRKLSVLKASSDEKKLRSKPSFSAKKAAGRKFG